MVAVRWLDHQAIAVRDLGEAVQLFGGVLGGEFLHGGDDEDLGIRVLQYRMPGGGKIELMTPLSGEGYLQRFLDRHGPGFHHMTLLVEDLASAVEELTTQGYQLADVALADARWREAFLRPSQGFGLIQVAESTLDWSRPAGDHSAEDVLAGRMVWRGHRPVFRDSVGP